VIAGRPNSIPGEHKTDCHGGRGPFFVRTLLDEVPNCAFRYVRDLTLEPGSSIGEHPHWGDDEIYFLISGEGVAVVDGEESRVGPGCVVLTQSGSRHALRNTGTGPLRIFVACARNTAT